MAASLTGCTSSSPEHSSVVVDQIGFTGYPTTYPSVYRVSEYSGISMPTDYPAGQSSRIERPESRSVVSPKQADLTWVSEQSPETYTIEVGDADKAYLVAGQLARAPKKERTAQVKYSRQGRYFYKGLYGSFSSQQAAHEALEALPAELRQTSRIESWGNVQGVLQ